MGDKTTKVQIRLTEEQLMILRWLGRYDAENMTDWICQAIKTRASELASQGYTKKVMRSQL